MTDALPLVQHPGRKHIIGSAEPEEIIRYFTAESTLDEVLIKQLRSKQQEMPCTVVRDLFAGTEQAGTVILTCEKTHHTDILAHRQTNPDGSVTTWRA